MPNPIVCEFPTCTAASTIRHPSGLLTCQTHAHVEISSTGSWVDDHHTEGGHG